MLQSSEHQNSQAQEQFLPSGNPFHEHLTIIVTYLTHILSLHFGFAHNTYKTVYCITIVNLYSVTPYLLVLFVLFYYLLFSVTAIAVVLRKLLSRKQIPYMCKHTCQ